MLCWQQWKAAAAVHWSPSYHRTVPACLPQPVLTGFKCSPVLWTPSLTNISWNSATAISGFYLEKVFPLWTSAFLCFMLANGWFLLCYESPSLCLRQLGNDSTHRFDCNTWSFYPCLKKIKKKPELKCNQCDVRSPKTTVNTSVVGLQLPLLLHGGGGLHTRKSAQ